MSIHISGLYCIAVNEKEQSIAFLSVCSADLLVIVRVMIVLNIQFFCLHNFPQMTDNVDEIMLRDPPRMAPRVAAFQGADGGHTDYFIFIEKAVLCKVNTFAKAIMFWFVSHYVFKLEYEKRLKDVALFFQEFVFGLPAGTKKSALYLTVTSDLHAFAQ